MSRTRYASLHAGRPHGRLADGNPDGLIEKSRQCIISPVCTVQATARRALGDPGKDLSQNMIEVLIAPASHITSESPLHSWQQRPTAIRRARVGHHGRDVMGSTRHRHMREDHAGTAELGLSFCTCAAQARRSTKGCK